MAYMNQERKAELAPAIKATLKKHGCKGTISVRHHSTLVVTISEGALDLIGAANERNKAFSEMTGREHYTVEGNFDVNPYYIGEHFSGAIREFLTELHTAMMRGNFDNSDPMSDYFHVGWYVDIKVGSWNKPYKLNA